ncbi:MAG: T9SS type A sorting domain-containing protein [Algoriphagus sp.]|uniref:T9SS type A sorting domain-containing protein n=1 Tax=Algoriphagus sp. TaxID=1872435 RepID=UPI00272F69F6|nr:T9SS type A sorting domain-containing protein [Algoriphagus sp.]MDP2042775.1 T9SS type A sorting domain-containing protein [Algoriphagus sp.]MDP3472173.1 T9SS type A sorting domain-containing protein [Algoriphagus sp.]
MDAICFTASLSAFFTCRIYRLFLSVAGVCLILQFSFSQEINAYKTIASGDFHNIFIWVVWDGTSWNPAVVKPGQANDVYINQTHTLRLIGNEETKNLFINAEPGAGQKLNLNGYNLNVFGSLQAFSGPAPGSPSNAWNSQNWIGNSINSTLTFKGDSRTLIEKNSWSAQTTQSRFSVIFEANAGEQFVLEAPFKTLSFTVRSGQVLQKLDISVIPNVCFTLSFNTETTVFGAGPFGELIIEPGATFISECNATILNRSTSGTVSALNFDLQNGGTLILEGSTPRIESANFQMNGKVIHRGGTSAKTFLSSTYADASSPNAVRDLELQGNQNLTLPSNLTLLGNLEKSGTGNFITTGTSLTLVGSTNQYILGFPLEVRDLILNKAGGIFYPNASLSIQRNLTLLQGIMDLSGSNLLINTGLAGTLSYSGGSWRNIGQLTYFGIPTNLTGSNATFPFEDTKNGGIRKVQLLGTSAGGNLCIKFTEYKGAEYNSEFDDVDGTPILYRLFSYFHFSNLSPSTNPLELRISANDLIVDNVDDLRIVGTGYAAPGNHLAGLDPDELWARRELTFADLLGVNFTVGSFRTLSILPLTWLELNSESTKEGNLIKWKVAREKENLLFEVYRSEVSNLKWKKIGEEGSKGDSDLIQEYSYLDRTAEKFQSYFYKIRQIDNDGRDSWSHVIRKNEAINLQSNSIQIFPNPHAFGEISINLKAGSEYEVSVLDFSGRLIKRFIYSKIDFSTTLKDLRPGAYILGISDGNYFHQIRFLKN